ncbi:hypothetical protein AB838_06200 [Rhodobacteraceae bacterium (ex Bugula neritina AB1)]|nr:hypothetical protein AB838_06200 [Rhodobacteraceae bacterium (ex Bugula neritina AB1)]
MFQQRPLSADVADQLKLLHGFALSCYQRLHGHSSAGDARQLALDELTVLLCRAEMIDRALSLSPLPQDVAAMALEDLCSRLRHWDLDHRVLQPEHIEKLADLHHALGCGGFPAHAAPGAA